MKVNAVGFDLTSVPDTGGTMKQIPTACQSHRHRKDTLSFRFHNRNERILSLDTLGANPIHHALVQIMH